MKGKIILEEAWNLPRLSGAAGKYASPEGAGRLAKNIQDIQGRLREMDEQGVEVQVLSFTSPGTQGVADKDEAEALAEEANNYIAAECAQHPMRFANFAAVSMHDPVQAAREARRCMEDLKFVGVMLNDFQTVASTSAPDWAEVGEKEGERRVYFDHPSYDPFWAEMERLGYPVYMHPRLLSGDFFSRRPWLAASANGFKIQLANHVLAIATAGVFDRFPRLKLVIGHMGEGIVGDLWRLDHKLDRQRFPNMGMRKDRLIRDYFSKNIFITTSGHFSTRMLQNALAELGSARVLFSVDYPYEDTLANGCKWMDSVPVADVDRLKVARTNAIELLRLSSAPWGLRAEEEWETLELGGLTGHVFGEGVH